MSSGLAGLSLKMSPVGESSQGIGYSWEEQSLQGQLSPRCQNISVQKIKDMVDPTPLALPGSVGHEKRFFSNPKISVALYGGTRLLTYILPFLSGVAFSTVSIFNIILMMMVLEMKV